MTEAPPLPNLRRNFGSCLRVRILAQCLDDLRGTFYCSGAPSQTAKQATAAAQ